MKNDLSTTSSRLTMVFMGILISAIGFQYWHHALKTQSNIQQHSINGINVDAVVIAMHSKPSGKYRIEEPHVEFEDQSGVKRQALLTVRRSSGIWVGKKLEVTYLPGKYDRVLLKGAYDPRTVLRGQLMVGAGLVVFLFGAYPRGSKKKTNSKTLDELREEGKKLVAESRKAYKNPPEKKPLPLWRVALNVILIPVVLGFLVYAFKTEDFAHTTSGVVISNTSANGSQEIFIEYVDDRLVKRQVPLMDAAQARGLQVGQTVRIDYGVGKRDSVKLDKPPKIPFIFWYFPMFLCVMILALNCRRTDQT